MDVIFYKWARKLFYASNRAIISLLLGFRFYQQSRIEINEQQIIVANHNSHLDAFVMMALISSRDVPKVKLVAAKDYWSRTKFLNWFSNKFIGAILLDRQGESEDPLAPIHEAIEQGYSVILFPEGTRGEPEVRQPLRFGIAKLAQMHKDIKVRPVFLNGLGKALPKGGAFIVPFICHVNIGKTLSWQGKGKAYFMSALEDAFKSLEKQVQASELF